MSDLILLCAGAVADRPVERRSRDPDPHDGSSRLPDPLGRLLRSARVDSDRQDDALVPVELPHESWLRRLLAVPADMSVEACAAAEHGVAPGCWRLTPVHIQVGHDQMRLVDPDQLALSQDEALRLAEAAGPVLAEAGFSLDVSAAHAWFIRGPAPPRWHARAWTLAVGRSIDAYLPTGDDARLWRRLFTEIQMSWHGHPVNEAREAAGLSAVNAVWLDGWCGPLPQRAPAGLLAGNDPALRGLARLAGWSVAALDADAGDPSAALAALRRSAAPLVLDLDFWRRARRNGDDAHWYDGWVRLARFLSPILSAGRWPVGVERVVLVLTGERRCVELSLTRGARWLPWRRLDAQRLLLRP